jgi:ribosomal protein S18 acetylase RimI-like enzyme
MVETLSVAESSKANMQVALASIDDIPSWLSLATEVEPLFGPMVNDPGFHKALRETIECAGAFCVREDDGPPGVALLGAIMFRRSDSSYKVGWLAVTKKARRKGIGRLLLEHVLSSVISPATITVTTFREDEPEGLPARRFYESLGFQPGELRESRGLPRQVFTCQL